MVELTLISLCHSSGDKVTESSFLTGSRQELTVILHTSRGLIIINAESVI